MSTSQIFNLAKKFEDEAHQILGTDEAASKSRIFTLAKTYQKLDDLSAKQDDMLRQALRCVELEVFRGSHVMAWAAMIDYLQEYAADDNFASLKQARANWTINSMEDLRENHTEYALIDGMHVAKLITKGEKKAFHGLLHKRNECAHPSDYYPDLNESLGYISEIIARLYSHRKRVTKNA